MVETPSATTSPFRLHQPAQQGRLAGTEDRRQANCRHAYFVDLMPALAVTQVDRRCDGGPALAPDRLHRRRPAVAGKDRTIRVDQYRFGEAEGLDAVGDPATRALGDISTMLSIDQPRKAEASTGPICRSNPTGSRSRASTPNRCGSASGFGQRRRQ